jgi:hypothetical protein
MQLKCPGCSQLLNIPDTAAGKVVKCPCGKSLQAPGALAKTPAATATAPLPPQAAPSRPSPAAPAGMPQPAAAATQAPKPAAGPTTATKLAGPSPYTVPVSNDFDLTETDLAPVRGVSRPGQSKPAPKSNENELLRKYAKEEGGNKNSIKGSRKVSKPMMFLFVGIGILIGGMLLTAFFVVTRSE